jgi:hypothetical protein
MPLACARLSPSAAWIATSYGTQQVKLPFRDQPADGPAFYKLQGNEKRPIGFVHVVDLGSCRMGDGRRRPGFLQEAALTVGVGGQFLLEHLESHGPPEAGVPRR